MRYADNLAELRRQLTDDADLRRMYREARAEALAEDADNADNIGGVLWSDIADLVEEAI